MRSLSRTSSAASTYLPSGTTLSALQASQGEALETLEPLTEEDVQPGSFDLVPPAAQRNDNHTAKYSLEDRSEKIFSKDHLAVIFSDPALTVKFTGFLCTHRPSSIPLLVYYLDASKALKAIAYSNAIQESLEPLAEYDFTNVPSQATLNSALEERANKAFEILVQEELPRFVTHCWIQTVSESLRKKITGTMPDHLLAKSEGLAEVFCLSDPSRQDNPIIFASEGEL